MSREVEYLYFEKKILGLSCYMTQSEQILRRIQGKIEQN